MGATVSWPKGAETALPSERAGAHAGDAPDRIRNRGTAGAMAVCRASVVVMVVRRCRTG